MGEELLFLPPLAGGSQREGDSVEFHPHLASPVKGEEMACHYELSIGHCELHNRNPGVLQDDRAQHL